MCRTNIFFPLLSILISLVASSGRLSADDWPQWRGPTRDDVWKEAGIIDKFANPQIPLRWRTTIGSGYSGPTVAEGRVYVADRQVEPVEVERVHCFEWQTGHNLWTFSYDYGTARTDVLPDQLVWHLTIKNKGSKLPSVAEQQTKIVPHGLSFLTHTSIKDTEVQISKMAFGENGEYRSPQSNGWPALLPTTRQGELLH